MATTSQKVAKRHVVTREDQNLLRGKKLLQSFDAQEEMNERIVLKETETLYNKAPRMLGCSNERATAARH